MTKSVDRWVSDAIVRGGALLGLAFLGAAVLAGRGGSSIDVFLLVVEAIFVGLGSLFASRRQWRAAALILGFAALLCCWHGWMPTGGRDAWWAIAPTGLAALCLWLDRR